MPGYEMLGKNARAWQNNSSSTFSAENPGSSHTIAEPVISPALFVVVQEDDS
jgi:hypothetical protein